MLVVWSDDIDHIIPLCSEFEQKLMKLVWRNRHLTIGTPSVTTSNSGAPSTTGSYDNLNEKERDVSAQVTDAAATVALAEKEKVVPRTAWSFGWKLSGKAEDKGKEGESDPEKGQAIKPRPIRYFAPVYGGLGMGLAICEFRHEHYFCAPTHFLCSLLGFWSIHPRSGSQIGRKLYSSRIGRHFPLLTLHLPVLLSSSGLRSHLSVCLPIFL